MDRINITSHNGGSHSNVGTDRTAKLQNDHHQKQRRQQQKQPQEQQKQPQEQQHQQAKTDSASKYSKRTKSKKVFAHKGSKETTKHYGKQKRKYLTTTVAVVGKETTKNYQVSLKQDGNEEKQKKEKDNGINNEKRISSNCGSGSNLGDKTVFKKKKRKSLDIIDKNVSTEAQLFLQKGTRQENDEYDKEKIEMLDLSESKKKARRQRKRKAEDNIKERQQKNLGTFMTDHSLHSMKSSDIIPRNQTHKIISEGECRVQDARNKRYNLRSRMNINYAEGDNDSVADQCVNLADFLQQEYGVTIDEMTTKIVPKLSIAEHSDSQPCANPKPFSVATNLPCWFTHKQLNDQLTSFHHHNNYLHPQMDYKQQQNERQRGVMSASTKYNSSIISQVLLLDAKNTQKDSDGREQDDYLQTILSSLDNELELFGAFVRLRPAECDVRYELLGQLNDLAQNVFETNSNNSKDNKSMWVFSETNTDVDTVGDVKLKVFGSFASLDVCTFQSDIDLALMGVVRTSERSPSSTHTRFVHDSDDDSETRSLLSYRQQEQKRYSPHNDGKCVTTPHQQSRSSLPTNGTPTGTVPNIGESPTLPSITHESNSIDNQLVDVCASKRLVEIQDRKKPVRNSSVLIASAEDDFDKNGFKKDSSLNHSETLCDNSDLESQWTMMFVLDRKGHAIDDVANDELESIQSTSHSSYQRCLEKNDVDINRTDITTNLIPTLLLDDQQKQEENGSLQSQYPPQPTEIVLSSSLPDQKPTSTLQDIINTEDVPATATVRDCSASTAFQAENSNEIEQKPALPNINRDLLDHLVLSNDVDNVVLDQDAVVTTAPDESINTLHTPQCIMDEKTNAKDDTIHSRDAHDRKADRVSSNSNGNSDIDTGFKLEDTLIGSSTNIHGVNGSTSRNLDQTPITVYRQNSEMNSSIGIQVGTCYDDEKNISLSSNTVDKEKTIGFSFKGNLNTNTNLQKKPTLKRKISAIIQDLMTTESDCASGSSSSEDDLDFDKGATEEDRHQQHTTLSLLTPLTITKSTVRTMKVLHTSPCQSDEEKGRELGIKALTKLSKKLRRAQHISQSVNLIKFAKVPIIKVQTRYGFEVDIAISGQTGTDTSLFAIDNIKAYKSFAVVVLFLKVLLAQHSLDEPFKGGLGSYKLYVLVSHHMKKHIALGGNDHPAEILLSFLYRYGGDSGRNYNDMNSRKRRCTTQSRTNPALITKLHRYTPIRCSANNSMRKRNGSAGVADLSNVYQLDSIIDVFKQCYQHLTTLVLKLLCTAYKSQTRNKVNNTVQKSVDSKGTNNDDKSMPPFSFLAELISDTQLAQERKKCLNDLKIVQKTPQKMNDDSTIPKKNVSTGTSIQRMHMKKTKLSTIDCTSQVQKNKKFPRSPQTKITASNKKTKINHQQTDRSGAELAAGYGVSLKDIYRD